MDDNIDIMFSYNSVAYTTTDLKKHLVNMLVDIPYTDPKDSRLMVHEYFTVMDIYYEVKNNKFFSRPECQHYAKMRTEVGGDTVIKLEQLFRTGRVVPMRVTYKELADADNFLKNRTVHWSDLTRQLGTYDSGFQHYGIE